MSPYRILIAVLAALSLLTGCHSYAVADDIDIEFNFAPLVGPSDQLHLPYVQGTQVSLWILGAGNSADAAHFKLKSGNESVFHIDSQQGGSAQCSAVGAGTAAIQVLRDGEVVDTTEVIVKAPTRATLTPNGPLIVGAPFAQAVGSTTHVFAGGTSTYLVEYFAGDEQLFGNGVLVPSASAGLVAKAETTFLFENREWLQLTPAATGTQTVALSAGGVALGTLTVDTVDETAVTRVALVAQDSSGVHDGRPLAVLAQSFDAKFEPIFGIDYTWEHAGVLETGEGDLFRFDFDSSRSDTLSAHFGAMSAVTIIQARPGSGVVDSSNRLGCTVRALPGAPARSFPAVALAALAAWAFTRKRGRRERRAGR